MVIYETYTQSTDVKKKKTRWKKAAQLNSDSSYSIYALCVHTVGARSFKLTLLNATCYSFYCELRQPGAHLVNICLVSSRF